MVMVGVDDRLGGAIEMQAAVRPEVKDIIAGLQKRGIKHIAIISGDHEVPTRKLAESLGMNRYFAQCCPPTRPTTWKSSRKKVQGLLRRRCQQRLHRSEESQRLDLARAVDRDQHDTHRLPGRKTAETARYAI